MEEEGEGGGDMRARARASSARARCAAGGGVPHCVPDQHRLGHPAGCVLYGCIISNMLYIYIYIYILSRIYDIHDYITSV